MIEWLLEEPVTGQPVALDAKSLVNRLQRGAVLGGVCALVTFAILLVFRNDAVLGAATAGPAVIGLLLVVTRT